MSISQDNTTAYMKVKTRGNTGVRGKPRVYFTCHPDDFDRYFDDICEAIFKTQDCAIYYTADMAASIPETYRDTDLGGMNLFVIPVTFRLLTENNRAMQDDFVFADEKHIPVLPLMMESGIDEFYSQKFGKRQYLSPYSHDLTEISYEEKLKKYLSSILLDDNTIARIQAAFDAYIFLSYRKKDRHHANELMRLIHKNSKYQDIAIWYDEYLTPGENFDDVIRMALDKSELFTLLVTPNLINEANYVQQEEYPAAHKAGKRIVPAEMVPTDRNKLETDFIGVPPCVNAHNDADLHSSLVEAIKGLAVRQNDNDPEHNYLIGLAYLEGIDVEVDIDRGLRLITSAAEAEFPEAMNKLYHLFDEGQRVLVDYSKVQKWACKLFEYYLRELGEKNRTTLMWLNNLASAHDDMGDYGKAMELHQKAYTLRCELLGQNHPETLTSLNNLAVTYSASGKHTKALELEQKVYTLRCEVLGEKHRSTLKSLNNLAYFYARLSKHKQALVLGEKLYTLCCEALGEKHQDTLRALGNLAVTYGKLGKHTRETELLKKVYALRCEILGEKHPDTLISLSNLAVTYGELGNYDKALELKEKIYALRGEILGEKHPDTLTDLKSCAYLYGKQGNHKKEVELLERHYLLHCEILGEMHPSVLSLLNDLAIAYGIFDCKKKAELEEKGFRLGCKYLGEKHSTTLMFLNNLAVSYRELGDHKKEVEYLERLYTLRCEMQGEKDLDTLISLRSLTRAYDNLGNHEKGTELREKFYSLRHDYLEEVHSDPQNSDGWYTALYEILHSEE